MSSYEESDASSDSTTEQKYCRTCGWVEPARGFHPEYGPSDHCPVGGFDHALYSSKERMIDLDHERALLQTDKELSYL
ncbi:hypothetical protein ELS19_04485 [Halogeometricum borinquense]|uniref:Uncharacterized protein n=1 Tax=Halogeometricum borinquense TaxID=60847 RepID=A0A482TAP8_9EURY|nr:hypothetical protein [Halogeometricum borinquense]RYJ13296.1 hypothetical protein ELS19_04485 [Halogeometricum borinquense]